MWNTEYDDADHKQKKLHIFGQQVLYEKQDDPYTNKYNS
jgi:hypothetical protein